MTVEQIIAVELGALVLLVLLLGGGIQESLKRILEAICKNTKTTWCAR